MTKTKEEFVPITTREMYEQPRPSDLLTWTMCRHLCHNKASFGIHEKCELCPESRPDEDVADDERVIDGCRVLAEEYARLAMAALTKEGWRPPE
jgi:hypothetical protein